MKPPPPLGLFELSLAGSTLVAAGALSVGLRLGIGRSLAIAATRMMIQLVLIGLILRTVFALQVPELVIGLVLIMTANAARASVARTGRRLAGATPLAFLCLLLSGCVVSAVGSGVIVGVDPWWTPQVWIPLAGMILGNSLTGIALCMDRCLSEFSDRRGEVDLRIALGSTRWEAARPVLVEAVRAGSLPIINSMAVCGLVSLPGMMTGQILSGVDPVEAVRYQVVIMFLIGAATVTGCMLFAVGLVTRVFDETHRLRPERIRRT